MDTHDDRGLGLDVVVSECGAILQWTAAVGKVLFIGGDVGLLKDELL